MVKVAVDELERYFTENKDKLADWCPVIAKNEDRHVEIFLTEVNGFPYFSVELDSEEVYATHTSSYVEAENAYKELLSTFICTEEDSKEAADKRAEEIAGAVEEMLGVLIEEDPREVGFDDEDMEDIASLVEQYLFEQYGVSVRHPTKTGGVLVQYPMDAVIGTKLA